MKAFPAYEYQKAHDQMMPVGGMDLRDYFAAKALNAFLFKLTEDYVMSDAASDAYLVANEMIKARK